MYTCACACNTIHELLIRVGSLSLNCTENSPEPIQTITTEAPTTTETTTTTMVAINAGMCAVSLERLRYVQFWEGWLDVALRGAREDL